MKIFKTRRESWGAQFWTRPPAAAVATAAPPMRAGGGLLAVLWLLLLAVLAGGLLAHFHLPGAWLMGPLVVAALSAIRGKTRIAVPWLGYRAAQAIIGVALSFSVSVSSISVIRANWLPVSALVAGMLIFTVFNAWLLIRFSALDPATALLGTLPGGAGEMTAMSESLHADTRLVAVMQYTRVVLIVFTVTLVAHFFGNPVSLPAPGAAAAVAQPNAALHHWTLAAGAMSILCAVVGATIGIALRVPAGALIVPAFLGVAWQMLGHAPPAHWPEAVLALAYITFGLGIGARFEPSVVARLRTLAGPIVGTSALLLAGSAAMAWWLVRVLPQESMFSAYLAATPGGIDSVAAVATDLKADATLVLAVHFLRLMSVLVVGPPLVRALSGRLHRAGLRRAPVG
ncbi:MAG: AbrB family transcriptional regulator [Verrucomicrobia bacterium]|nr:AbrB family transcriptional regulator [Verrucomicrobiota bacterium]